MSDEEFIGTADDWLAERDKLYWEVNHLRKKLEQKATFRLSLAENADIGDQLAAEQSAHNNSRKLLYDATEIIRDLDFDLNNVGYEKVFRLVQSDWRMRRIQASYPRN
jgi:hypothetical protein